MNNQVYRVALGENLFALCEARGGGADGSIKNLIFWRKGQSDVKQFSGHCFDLDINNSSCIAPRYEEYKRTRVKTYRIRTGGCYAFFYQRSYLDISIANWTDNGSYSCVSSRLPNTQSQLQWQNVSTHIIIG